MKILLAITFLLLSTLHANAQDENAKKLSGKSKGYSLLNAGLESIQHQDRLQ